MEQPALRDVERRRQWQDKIEVRLDNRQVFFLFFGSAVVACMLFVLGVLVGKRIESRGRADAPEVQDPLGVLDRAGAPAPAAAVAPAPLPELTFPSKLMAAPSVRPKPAPPAPPRPVPVAAPPKLLPVAAPKPLAAAPAPPKLVAADALPKPVAAAATKPPAKGKFTLHLANFATKEEADAFARKFSAQGAFVVSSDVPDKGTVYRVRCGNFPTLQDATTAKAAFEKQNKVIALVAAR
jgi:cell division septation protein DedD